MVRVIIERRTERDLRRTISTFSVRSDPFCRLSVFLIETAPLQEPDDHAPQLIESFIDRHASKADGKCRAGLRDCQARYATI